MYVPLIIVLFALLLLGISAFQFIKHAIQKDVHGYDICKIVIAILILGFTIVLNLCRLLNGGLALIYERENDAVTIEGTISEISEMGKFEFPELRTEYKETSLNGTKITIDNIKCVCPNIGDFEIGDSVVVVYLPESGYILSIERVYN